MEFSGTVQTCLRTILQVSFLVLFVCSVGVCDFCSCFVVCSDFLFQFAVLVCS